MEPIAPVATAQWAHFPAIEDVKPVSAAEMTVLLEVREVLARNGLLDRFGVTLLHRHFDLAEDEHLVEYTDTAARTQVLRVEKADTPLREGEGLIETNFVFNHPSAPIRCAARCKWYRGYHD